MAKTFSSLQDKKQTHVKIGNFYIKKKVLFIGAILLVIAIVMIKYQNYQKEKEKEQRLLNAQLLAQTEEEETNVVVLSLHDQIQKQLSEKYGIAPEGFEWDYDGSLITLATLEDMTAEDVVYTYAQSVHMLDFATAQRVASYSTIIDSYNEYYDISTTASLDISDTFKRKQFKLALNRMSIDRVVDFVVLADGTQIYTLAITCLDLSNKDFWEDEAEDIYNTMYTYDKTEMDMTKRDQFVYDYIYNAYDNELCGYHTVNIDFVVSKTNGGSWLVSDDSELRKVLLYEYGIDVYTYIIQKYQDWLIDRESGSWQSAGPSIGSVEDDPNESPSYNTHTKKDKEIDEKVDHIFNSNGSDTTSTDENNSDGSKKDLSSREDTGQNNTDTPSVDTPSVDSTYNSNDTKGNGITDDTEGHNQNDGSGVGRS